MIDKKISDNISVTDSIRKPVKGVVRLYDENGNVVFEKENTVVEDGRKLIYSLFDSCINSSDTNKKNVTFKLNFSYLSTQVVTNPKLTLSRLYDSTNSSTIVKSSDLEYNTNIVPNSEDLSFVITHTLSSDSGLKFNNIFLSYIENTNGTETLFSRVALDDIFLGAGAEYTLQYTLYF